MSGTIGTNTILLGIATILVGGFDQVERAAASYATPDIAPPSPWTLLGIGLCVLGWVIGLAENTGRSEDDGTDGSSETE